MSTYGFAEGSDFTSVKSSTLVNNGAEREISDYQVSIDIPDEPVAIEEQPKQPTVAEVVKTAEKEPVPAADKQETEIPDFMKPEEM